MASSASMSAPTPMKLKGFDFLDEKFVNEFLEFVKTIPTADGFFSGKAYFGVPYLKVLLLELFALAFEVLKDKMNSTYSSIDKLAEFEARGYLKMAKEVVFEAKLNDKQRDKIFGFFNAIESDIKRIKAAKARGEAVTKAEIKAETIRLLDARLAELRKSGGGTRRANRNNRKSKRASQRRQTRRRA
jgi:hypothetical protein